MSNTNVPLISNICFFLFYFPPSLVGMMERETNYGKKDYKNELDIV